MSMRKPTFFSVKDRTARFTINETEFIIDAEDAEYLKNRSWHLLINKKSLRTYLRGWDTSKKKKVLFHRLIAKAEPGTQIDHINGNSLDNRKSNLRVCTHTENIWNRPAHSNNTSGYKGVSRSGKKWKACIKAHKKFKYLGTFETAKDAADAYNIVAKQLHKQFTHPNSLGE